jgi:regulator of sigma E protease
MNLNALTVMFSHKFLPMLYAIIGFGLLITIHEFGHFIFCKIFKIHTPTFSIGMGPKVVERKIGNTNFRLSAIPLGGYVEIAGLAEIGQGEQEHSKIEGNTSFASKPYWQKLFVLLGGVLFNLLFAYIVFSTLFFIGIQKQTAEVLISSQVKATVVEKFGLQAGDKIITINDETLSSNPKELIPQIHEKIITPLIEDKDTQLKLQILRNNKKISVNIKPETKKIAEKFIYSLEPKTTPIKGEYEKLPLIGAIVQGIKTTNQWITQILYGIKYLITQRTLKGAGGPIMIISKTFETAQRGIIPLLIFLAIISINLAIINILPIGALDGGQVLFATIETIIRREIPEIIKLVINISSWILLLGLILYLSYQDLLALITGNR